MDYPSREEIRAMTEYILREIQPVPEKIGTPLIYGSSCIIELFKGTGIRVKTYHGSPSHPVKAEVKELEEFLNSVWEIPYDTREERYVSPTTKYMWGVDKAFLNVVELARRVKAPYIIPSNANIGQGLIQDLVG